MNGIRHAAVAIHRLGEDDRNWLLNALSVDERGAIKPLLAELAELGFGDEAMACVDLAPAAGASQTMLQRLQHCSAERMFALFEHEPLALTGQFLSLQHWPWEAAFLAKFPPARRDRILAAKQPVLASARAAFLLGAAATRLPDEVSIGADVADLPKSSPTSVELGSWTKKTVSHARKWATAWIR